MRVRERILKRINRSRRDPPALPFLAKRLGVELPREAVDMLTNQCRIGQPPVRWTFVFGVEHRLVIDQRDVGREQSLQAAVEGSSARLEQWLAAEQSAPSDQVMRQEQLQRLAKEQAALRRVATLVAQAVRPAEIFAAVAVEVRALFGADSVALARLEDDGTAVIVAVAPRTDDVTVDDVTADEFGTDEAASAEADEQ